MEKQTVYIIVACILAVCFPLLPKIIQIRVWILRKIHLFRLADWVERNAAILVKVFQVIFAAAILVLLLLAAGAI
jgi:hypothetical protein